MTIFEVLAKNLKDLREEENITQQVLADKLQIPRANLGRYETRENVPPLDVLAKYSDYFRVSIDFLIGKANK